MKYYKILVNGKSCHGGTAKWPLPKNGKPGKWMPAIEGELELCENGYHVVRAEHILEWLKDDAQIFEVEVRGMVKHEDSKGVCGQLRLTRQLKWNDRVARRFACDCAERVLPIFERKNPKVTALRHTIQTARRYADGKATDKELSAASSAAWSAAWSGERSREQKWQTKRLLHYLNGGKP